ncbi:MAG: response regulator transcription factor [Hyphomicrobiales bacterium]|nr:response regulator transcription factor [Hyphomicrobiales bacterium]
MSDRKRILIVDDEPQIQRFLKPALVAGGYAVAQAASGREALRQIDEFQPDAIVLDLGLPDMDGKTVIVRARQTSDTPIIVLSAREQEAEKIAALDLGANDYVAKPFGIAELLARVRAALRPRRSQSPDAPLLRIGDIVIDVPAHRVTRADAPVVLTPKEFDLLLLLARNAGRVVTHRQLLAHVWGPAHVADTQYLRVFIGQLRAKLEANPAEPTLIATEPGVGYRMTEGA